MSTSLLTVASMPEAGSGRPVLSCTEWASYEASQSKSDVDIYQSNGLAKGFVGLFHPTTTRKAIPDQTPRDRGMDLEAVQQHAGSLAKASCCDAVQGEIALLPSAPANVEASWHA
mmetsp:Transcript_14707/g.34412  ORF Transcript_14707/g.34412 Transcript_14707/m.34412 type:complete len:115 (+) Transcript_14707:893-1237(+)